MTDQTQAPSSIPKKSDLKDPEQAELETKLSKDINAMPDEVKDRFKAIKVLYDEINDLMKLMSNDSEKISYDDFITKMDINIRQRRVTVAENV